MNKIELEKDTRYQDHDRRCGHIALTKCLPFYRTRQKPNKNRPRLTHIVRTGKIINGVFGRKHMSFSLYCGQIGSISADRPRGILLKELERGEVMCATCMGKAVGAGKFGVRMIKGKPVLFSPKDRENNES